MRSRRRAFLLVAIGLVGACSGGGGDGDDGASLGSTLPPTKVTAPDVPAASPTGTGVVVIGAASSSFAVTTCELKAADAGAATSELVRITGEGTTAGGVAFQVEVNRLSTTGAVETFTDSITYTDTARILQVQRFEVAGEVTDLRDPDARGTLLRVRPEGLSATGIAGPPGAVAGKDEGLVGLALDATC